MRYPRHSPRLRSTSAAHLLTATCLLLAQTGRHRHQLRVRRQVMYTLPYDCVYEVAPATRPLPLPHFPHPLRPMPPPRSAFGLELSPAAISSRKLFTGHSRCLLENGVEEPSRPLSPTSPRYIINRCGVSTRRSLTSLTSRSSANRRTVTSEATAPLFRLGCEL